MWYRYMLCGIYIYILNFLLDEVRPPIEMKEDRYKSIQESISNEFNGSSII